jgi:hypothetical protein
LHHRELVINQVIDILTFWNFIRTWGLTERNFSRTAWFLFSQDRGPTDFRTDCCAVKFCKGSKMWKKVVFWLLYKILIHYNYTVCHWSIRSKDTLAIEQVLETVAKRYGNFLEIKLIAFLRHNGPLILSKCNIRNV